MSWLPLTPETVVAKVNGPELSALRTAALRSGQADPLGEILAEVVQEIRGYVAAGGFALGPADTIPAKLCGAALVMIRYRLYSRLPGYRSVTDARWHDNEDAQMLLRQVARGRFRVAEPGEEADTPLPRLTTRARSFSRDQQEGL